MRVTRSGVPIGQVSRLSSWRGCDGAFGVRNRIAVRIVRRTAEHLVDALDQPLGHDVLELLGLVVHFVPAHAHHLDQKQLDEAMAPEHEAGELLAGSRQTHAAVRLVFGEPRLRQRLHHRRRRARRDAERRGDLPHRHEPLARAAASTGPDRSP